MNTVLIIHPTLWSHYRARLYSEIHHRIQLQQLPMQIHVVHLASSEQSRAGLGEPSEELHQYPYTVLFKGFLEDFGLADRLKTLFRLIRQVKPTIVNVPGYYDAAVIALTLYCKARGIRVVMSVDSTQDDHVRIGWKEQIKRWIVSLASGFFCYGTRSADYLHQLGVRPEQILSKRNMVDNRALHTLYEQTLPQRAMLQQENRLAAHNFIYVGRLIDQLKNVSGLIRAFGEAQRMSNSTNDWGLIILGEGTDAPWLRDLAAQYSTASIQFVPGQPWYEIPSWLALADVLVLPSFSEPWGLVVNEAMACGLPVIVSNRCGCAIDLVKTGQNGFAFNPETSSELTQYLLKFMNNQVDKAAMGATSQQLIAPYSTEAVAQEMIDGFLKTATSK